MPKPTPPVFGPSLLENIRLEQNYETALELAQAQARVDRILQISAEVNARQEARRAGRPMATVTASQSRDSAERLLAKLRGGMPTGLVNFGGLYKTRAVH